MSDKWYVIMIVTIVLCISIMYAFDSYQENVALQNHCSQTIENNEKVWKCK